MWLIPLTDLPRSLWAAYPKKWSQNPNNITDTKTLIPRLCKPIGCITVATSIFIHRSVAFPDFYLFYLIINLLESSVKPSRKILSTVFQHCYRDQTINPGTITSSKYSLFAGDPLNACFLWQMKPHVEEITLKKRTIYSPFNVSKNWLYEPLK